MAVSKAEQSRKLSDAERRRLERSEQISEGLVSQGYRKTDLTIGIVRANVLTFVIGIPVVAVAFALFTLVNGTDGFVIGALGNPLLLVAMLVLVVVHELIHGLTWSRFTPNGMADIEFGFMKEYLTPYCTCKAPLPKTGYIIGSLAPGVLLGIVPTIVAIAMGSVSLLFLGVIMTLSGGGDALIVALLLRHKFTGAEQLIFDHPTQAGCLVFER